MPRTPVTLELSHRALTVRLHGAAAFFALRRQLEIPFASITGVAVAPRRLVPATGLRWPGTGLPGVIRAGSYGFGDRRDFWFAMRADTLLVVELQPGEPYRRLVLQVEDPHAEALRLRPYLGAYTGSF